ncbi:hypothetical protein [Rhizobium leucaenae]|uniref:Uncharacterized protein n=1 Tax=Rhizobium leucaenae TaxID=29450 RepID=A0A7W7EMG2_9HYPH|nr:hypothetical protein [Rhizobium leucaenae]MBB4569238.1 hypothetical protein [Rhizobium leucaenae]
MELKADAGAILDHLTSAQRQRLDALDAVYIELLSSDGTPAKADVEALADAVVALYDLVAGRRSGLENPA